MSEFFAQGGMESIEELFSMITTFFIALIPLLYLYRLRGNRERKNEERRRRLEAEEVAIAQKGSQNKETQEDYSTDSEEEGRVIGILEALLTGQAPGTRVPPTPVATPPRDERDRNQYDHDEDNYVSPYDEPSARPVKKPKKPQRAAATMQQPEAPAYAEKGAAPEATPDSSRHRMPSAQSTRPKRVRSVSEGRNFEDNNRPSIGFGFSTGLAETGIPKSPPVVSVASQRHRRSLKSLTEWQRGLVYSQILGAPRSLKKYSEDEL
ncbi:MAG: hypothetical protein EA428_06560 [Spirochaetaceae bacterium]|nr:MAG: hypothetical protein EA428_06560 [Spirochaetaceae bacterium]